MSGKTDSKERAESRESALTIIIRQEELVLLQQELVLLQQELVRQPVPFPVHLQLLLR